MPLVGIAVGDIVAGVDGELCSRLKNAFEREDKQGAVASLMAKPTSDIFYVG